MPKSKRRIKKELIMQKQHWKKIKKRYPFLDPRNHWYTGKVLTKQERKNTCPMLAIGSGDIPEGWTDDLVMNCVKNCEKSLSGAAV